MEVCDLLFIVLAAIGITVGVIVVLLTRQFRRTKKPRLVIVAPSIISILVSVLFMYIGNIEVEGVDGAAYMLLSLIIFCFGLIVLYITDKKESS